MRKSLLLIVPLVAIFCLRVPAHTGIPPALPTIEEVAPTTIIASATNCDVVGTSWCAYMIGNELRCKKNGSYVTLSFNSTTTNWPHAYHCDKTWNVNLTALNLVSGDSLAWEFVAWATAGPSANQRVLTVKTTTVQ